MSAIYTDPTTGKKYDRVIAGVVANERELWEGSKLTGCTGCAFQGRDCMHVDCTAAPTPTKRVHFIFKERKV